MSAAMMMATGRDARGFLEDELPAGALAPLGIALAAADAAAQGRTFTDGGRGSSTTAGMVFVHIGG
jgi:hypothetical protein